MLKFLKYCFRCMIEGIPAIWGHVKEGVTWRETLVGMATLIVIIAILFCILYFTGVISFKKK